MIDSLHENYSDHWSCSLLDKESEKKLLRRIQKVTKSLGAVIRALDCLILEKLIVFELNIALRLRLSLANAKPLAIILLIIL